MLDRGKIKMVIVGQSFYIYIQICFFQFIPCNKIAITIHIVERYLLKVYLLKWLAISQGIILIFVLYKFKSRTI